ncbi:sigma factor SigB regulation protein RsbQ [Marinobacter maroccanus]|uniref:Sigma factor SigB regulation protein RsbQ n=1 Tax=Marinobacter maroccanus TaxID=2055143 RepID=A0A2S5Z8C5_9GAMM|nr:alpha/beta hydrolase [Marinobacter maroccanus]PPI83484.1 sigma factor SigB regulation protein RsbQ [Marinobacter maroccanus]
MPRNQLAKQHHVRQLGPPPEATERPTLVLAHGFGCDQHIWAPVADMLAEEHPVVLFDHMGCGRSDMTAYDPKRYTNLFAYAEDLANLVKELELDRPILVGHSVSGAIGWLASIGAPDLFRQVIAIGPSPRYINDPPDYIGGFEEQDIHEMLDLMERNHFEWAGYLAPIVMAAEDRPEKSEDLRQTFLNADPVVSRRFAESIFMSDIREYLHQVTVPSLILYSDQDVIVPIEVIEYLHRTIPNCDIRKLQATGHYPHMSNPEAVADAILEGLRIEA